MSDYNCQPALSPLQAEVVVPGSKSLANRALVAAALADGHSLLENFPLAEDTLLMVEALRALGIAVTLDERAGVAEVSGCAGHLPAEDAELFCGNAGTVIRFCTALAATGYGSYRLDGVERMRQRPIGDLVEVLRALGTAVEFTATEGCPPLTVHGKHLRGGQVRFVSPASSQFVSALLLAAPAAMQDVLLEVTGAVPSRPYLQITTSVMDAFGVGVIEDENQGVLRFVVPAPQSYMPRRFVIEPDASNATYFLAAPAVAGGVVTVAGLGTDSVQGDARFVDILAQMGCLVDRQPASLTVAAPPAGSRLRGVDVDLNGMPDTVQTLAVVALFADGPTIIRNVANLRLKETDRLAALATELGKIGATVEVRDDGLTIHPPASPAATRVGTYQDHRMAMSFALAGLRTPGLVIEDPACCRKSFPDFFGCWESMLSGPQVENG